MPDKLPALSNADIIVAQRLDPVMRLKPRERRFVEAYVRTSDAKHSAIEAGYARSSAAVQGHKMLQREEIWTAVQELMVARAIANGLTVDRLVTELAVIALNRGYQEYDPETGTTITHGAEDRDRLKAIDMLMRHLGAYNDRLQISLDDPDIIEAAQRYGVDPNELVQEMAQLAPIDTGQS